jgi:hypothetical protein
MRGRSRLQTINPLALWAERSHPLVRAELKRGRRRRWTLTGLAVGTPLVFAGALAALMALPELGEAWGLADAAAVGWFVAFWPLALALLAGAGAADAVISERTEETAMQLVLTPLPRRILAAAKILPHLRAPLVGMLAALPFYLLIGATDGFYLQGVFPWLTALSPVRAWQAAWMDISRWNLELTPGGCAMGLFMWATDLGLVWAAAHAGAEEGVRRLGLIRAVLGLVGSAVALATLCWLAVGLITAVLGTAALLVFLLVKVFSGPLAEQLWEVLWIPMMLLGIPAFLAVWWRLVVQLPVLNALEAFAWFDVVFDDEFRRRPTEGWRYFPSRR